MSTVLPRTAVSRTLRVPLFPTLSVSLPAQSQHSLLLQQQFRGFHATSSSSSSSSTPNSESTEANGERAEGEQAEGEEEAASSNKNKRTNPHAAHASTASGVGVLRPIILLSFVFGMGGLLSSHDFDSSSDDIPTQIVGILVYPAVVFYETVAGLLESDESLLIPPPPVDDFGQTPRTVVINFEKTLAFPMWTRDDGWALRKRPHVDLLLQRLVLAGYEIVLWSSTDEMDASQYIMLLESAQLARHKLFRSHCNFVGGQYVRNVSRLGRDLGRVIVVDHNTEEVSSVENVVQIAQFVDDAQDTALLDLVVFLEGVKQYNISDVRHSVAKFNKDPNTCFDDEENFRVHAQNRLRGLTGGALSDSEAKESTIGRALGWAASWFGGTRKKLSVGGAVNLAAAEQRL
jgi:import inner membrane translocase subunit TIM50